MGWLGLALGGLGALGGLFSGKSKKGTSTSTITPNIPENLKPLEQLLIQNTMNRMNAKDVPLAGYEAQGIQGINNAYGLVSKNLQNRLTAQGLGGSNMGAQAQLQSELARAGQIGQFEASLPLLQEQYRRQYEQQAFQNALGVYGTIPKGATTTGEYTTPGNALGGMFSGAGSMLGWMMGQGMLGGSGGGAASTAAPFSMPQATVPASVWGGYNPYANLSIIP